MITHRSQRPDRSRPKKGEMLLTPCRRAGINVPTLCHMDGLLAHRRLPHVRGRGRGPARPGAQLRLPGGRRDEGPDALARASCGPARRSSSCCWPTIPTTASTASATATASCRRWPRSWACAQRRYAGERSNATSSTSPARRSSAIRPSASSAASACGSARRSRAWRPSTSSAAAARRVVGTAFDEGLNVSSCINCGQCIMVCPTGALREQSHIKEVLDALNDPDKIVVVQHAPAVSVTLGEEFGLQAGHGRGRHDDRRAAPARLRPRVRHLFTADLTIMEEGSRTGPPHHRPAARCR